MSSALISTEALDARRRKPGLRILDASWYLPSVDRDAAAEFAAEHIEGAGFFDLDAVSDADSNLPHMLPSADLFARSVGALGIGAGDHVVIYDGFGVMSSARVWWTFRVFGHDNVQILDGGLPKWKSEGRSLTAAPPQHDAVEYVVAARPRLVATLEEVRARLRRAPATIIDARPEGRFEGRTPEPRPGLRGGHMPGARNLPWTELYTDLGTLRPRPELEALLRRCGLERDDEVIATCGSGVTAALLALVLFELGGPRARVYDGSWAEWGSREDTSITTGPA